MTSIWFPNNKYPPNTKNYLPCFVLGGGGLVLGGRDYFNMFSQTDRQRILGHVLNFVSQRPGVGNCPILGILDITL